MLIYLDEKISQWNLIFHSFDLLIFLLQVSGSWRQELDSLLGWKASDWQNWFRQQDISAKAKEFDKKAFNYVAISWRWTKSLFDPSFIYLFILSYVIFNHLITYSHIIKR